MHLIEQLKKGLHTGFIQYQKDSLEEYEPSLLVNDRKREKKVLTDIIKELNSCDAFYFSVAFVTNSGIASLINTLKELEEKGVQGKIIVSQYQNFTQPEALRRLKALTNIELKIVTEDNFHAKSYIFRKGTRFTLIIGSSNLTQNALSYNKEWNLKVSSMENGDLLKYIMEEFNRTFNDANEVTDEWIEAYEKLYKMQYQAKKQIALDIQDTKKILPNKMQLEALSALNKLREEGKDKALLVSATGTGKTYFSAFDAQRVNPKRLLFVVHRENITRAALRSYRSIFGPNVEMGVLSGNSKAFHARFVFATVQTLSKEETLAQFSPDEFEYIVIDEVHRSGAKSYEKILNYF
ncbi:MAG: DEAD/DEAH box helicase family protein, partial [Cellulosilyticum sp.]|nr:DEAD/DEAH box helicase family protein [Cellulosilyticum sp.]